MSLFISLILFTINERIRKSPKHFMRCLLYLVILGVLLD